jgi:hypothetical protein
MPTEKQIIEAVEKLRAQLELSNELEQNLLQQAVKIEFWKALQPQLTILDSKSSNLGTDEIPSEQEKWALSHLARHGYFRLPPFIAPEVINRMSSCVETLRTTGWPTVFSYVYDEFWTVLRTPSMVRLLTNHLGSGYVQTSGIWTYRVDPKQSASGWAPHVDSSDDVERLSVWIPLTDATIDNGCMYVIPQDRVPSTLPKSMSDWTSISARDLGTLLHNVTPLPARAGSILGWNNRLIHWGGRATDMATGPRLSIAAEFLHKATRPRHSELPVFDNSLPGFAVRLLVIGQAILSYEKFEPQMRRYRGLATKLVEWERQLP